MGPTIEALKFLPEAYRDSSIFFPLDRTRRQDLRLERRREVNIVELQLFMVTCGNLVEDLSRLFLGSRSIHVGSRSAIYSPPA